MESNPWSDDESEEDEDKKTRDTNKSAARPPRPGFLGTIYSRGESQPANAPQPKRSAPETARAVTSPESDVARPAEEEKQEPTQAEDRPEQPQYIPPAEEIQQAKAEETDEDDEEEDEDDKKDSHARQLKSEELAEQQPVESAEPPKPETPYFVPPVELPSEGSPANAPYKSQADSYQLNDRQPLQQPTEIVPPVENQPLWQPERSQPEIARAIIPSEAEAAQPAIKTDQLTPAWEAPQPASLPLSSAEFRPVPSPVSEQTSGSAAAYVPAEARPSYYNETPVVRRERNNNPRLELAAAFATGVAIAWWLNRQSKRRDEQLSKQLEQANQRTADIEQDYRNFQAQTIAENQSLASSLEGQRRASNVVRPDMLPPIHARSETPRPVVEQLLGEQADHPPELPPKEHLGHSEWHSYVERDGHVVENAIDYGEAYHQERRAERTPTPFGSRDARFRNPSGTGQVVGLGMSDLPDLSLPSGQVPQDHSLPASRPDPQHLLPSKEDDRHPLAATIASPWLWFGVGILMIVFFLAATI